MHELVIIETVLIVSNMHLWYNEDITVLRYWSNDDVAVDDIKSYRVVEVYLYTLLTAVLDEGEWSASRPGHFTPGGRASLPVE